MQQFTYFLMFGLGLAMIIKGSDWFIDAVIWTATVFKIPYIIIGATIVSICTTMPETFVSLAASLKGQTDVAFGNAIGSVAINTGVIMVIIIIFAEPFIENMPAFKRSGVLLIGVLIFTWVSGLVLGEITRVIGTMLILFMVYYLISNFLQAKKMMDMDIKYDIEDDMKIDKGHALYEGVSYDEEEKDINVSRKVILKNIFFFIIGITLVIIGSNLLVDNGIRIAEILGVPSIVIAITFTALGTSLPELVTAITSIRKKVTNLGVGNIIGANILNIVQVLGISSLVTPIPLGKDPSILTFQFPLVIIIVSCAILFGVFGKNGFKRWHGAVIFAFYFIFLISNLLRENMPWFGLIIFG